MSSRVVFRCAHYGPWPLQQGRKFSQGWTSRPVRVSSAPPAFNVSESADNAEPCTPLPFSFVQCPKRSCVPHDKGVPEVSVSSSGWSTPFRRAYQDCI